MKQFVGRANELRILEYEFARPSSFILITGRRRIGKTALIGQFIRDKHAIYYFAGRQTSAMMLREFSECVAKTTGEEGTYFDSWRSAFSHIGGTGEKTVLAIDEFQNMLYAEPTITDTLQDLWDRTLSKRNIMLILCGSHMSVMSALANDYESPLYGRFTKKMVLKALRFNDICGSDFTDSVKRYSVHGGIPAYLDALGEGDLRDCVRTNVMYPGSILYSDPSRLLLDEVREPALYSSILKAVATGHHKLGDIASSVERPATSLTRPLTRLTEVGILRRDIPVTEPHPEMSRRGQYVFSDYSMKFFFGFVAPYSSWLELDEYDGAMAHYDAHFVDEHAAFVFEEVCRRSVAEMTDAIGFIPMRTGRYWGHKDIEIDVLAVNPEKKKAFAAECKFRRNKPVGLHELNSLVGKCENIPELEKYEMKYGLFSVSGFEENLRSTDTVLVDKGKVLNERTTGHMP